MGEFQLFLYTDRGERGTAGEREGREKGDARGEKEGLEEGERKEIEKE